MVTKLHRRMGAMIRENVQAALPQNRAVRISAGWFSIGNILPDISWLPATHPHFFRVRRRIFSESYFSLSRSTRVTRSISFLFRRSFRFDSGLSVTIFVISSVRRTRETGLTERSGT